MRCCDYIRAEKALAEVLEKSSRHAVELFGKFWSAAAIEMKRIYKSAIIKVSNRKYILRVR